MLDPLGLSMQFTIWAWFRELVELGEENHLFREAIAEQCIEDKSVLTSARQSAARTGVTDPALIAIQRQVIACGEVIAMILHRFALLTSIAQSQASVVIDSFSHPLKNPQDQ